MGQCLSPQKGMKNGKEITYNCGGCPPCRQNKVNEWAYRMAHEERTAISSAFVMLTYDTDHVPITKNGFMTLSKTDLQNFYKRYRYYHEKRYGKEIKNGTRPKLIYFGAGEYGSERERIGYGRPHYHISMLNADNDLIIKAWADKDGKPLGYVSFGAEGVTARGVAYTMDYIFGGSWKPKHKNDDRQKEFRSMSKGIGLSYIDKNKKWHQSALNERYWLPEIGGGAKKQKMPRYYKEKIYTEDQIKTLNWNAIQDAKRRIEEDRAKRPNWHWEDEQAKLQAYKRMAAKAKHKK